jgi:two-component system, OmpR family, sensor histidine kinase TctE
MSDRALPRTSIRRRLLTFLISSLVLMVAGASAVSYWVALRSANDAYDRSLLDPALDIAENLRIDATGAHVDLPVKALEVLVYDQVDRVIFQVRSPTNSIIEGSRDLPPPPELGRGQQIFFDGVSDGEDIRIAAHRTASGYIVQVGETLHKRNRLIGEILVADVVPTLLVAFAATALSWLGVTRALRPLEQLRLDLMRRAPRDLRPLPEAAAPVEIAPVVEAFNGLLSQVREASTMQQRFLANAAHQLRTPLAGLQMHLELLLRRTLVPGVIDEVERMHGATVRAGRLANQLLALAKAESARDQSRELERVDLRAIAGEAAAEWAPKAHALGIDLGFSLDPAEFKGDSLLLSELLDNLLDNALRYTPSGGSVTVRTGCIEGVPFLCIEDTGPGIPESERGKVLERFYRIPGTPGEGSGLGLSIVQEVVARHNGVLAIDVPAAHPGTRFCVYFTQSVPSAGQST